MTRVEGDKTETATTADFNTRFARGSAVLRGCKGEVG